MANTLTKGYTFGSTELVTNAKLHALVDNGTATIDAVTVSGTTENTFTIGDGLAGDKTIAMDNGGATLPAIRFNDLTNKWEFSNNGTLWSEMGSAATVDGSTFVNLASINASAGIIPAANLPTLGEVTQADLNPIRDNIALLAFRQQINDSVTLQKMEDGIVDEYEDESGVDASASTNELYSSGNDTYSPTRTAAAGTEFLANFDGVDGATSFTATTGQVATFVGTAQLDTAQSAFGPSSLLLDGNSDYITFPDSADWRLDSGNGSAFTLAFRIRFATLQDGNLFSQGTATNNHWTCWYDNTNKKLIFLCVNTGTRSFYYDCPFNPSANTWYHIAWVRVDGTNSASGWRVFVNGVSQTLTLGDGAWSGVFTDYASTLMIGLGSQPSYGYFNGWIDDVILEKGTAMWTSNFTPPASPAGVAANMEVISTGFTAVAQPDTVRAILFEENIDTVTLNTDLKAYASRDNGTTYTQGTLVNEGNYDTSKNILACDIDVSSQPAGTTIRYKVVTANNKDLILHGTGVLWR